MLELIKGPYFKKPARQPKKQTNGPPSIASQFKDRETTKKFEQKLQGSIERKRLLQKMWQDRQAKHKEEIDPYRDEMQLLTKENLASHAQK